MVAIVKIVGFALSPIELTLCEMLAAYEILVGLITDVCQGGNGYALSYSHIMKN